MGLFDQQIAAPTVKYVHVKISVHRQKTFSVSWKMLSLASGTRKADGTFLAVSEGEKATKKPRYRYQGPGTQWKSTTRSPASCKANSEKIQEGPRQAVWSISDRTGSVKACPHRYHSMAGNQGQKRLSYGHGTQQFSSASTCGLQGWGRALAGEPVGVVFLCASGFLVGIRWDWLERSWQGNTSLTAVIVLDCGLD